MLLIVLTATTYVDEKGVVLRIIIVGFIPAILQMFYVYNEDS